MLTYTLREAADLCDTTVKALRNRADRGSLQTVLRNNERRVPHAELERAGLLPDAEVKQLHQRITQLTDELAASRQLLVSNERSAAAECEARERLEATLYERQAAVTAAEAAAAEAQAALQTEKQQTAAANRSRGGAAGPRGGPALRGPHPGMEARTHPPQGRRRRVGGPSVWPAALGRCKSVLAF